MKLIPENAVAQKLPRLFIMVIALTPLLLAITPMAFTPQPENWQAFLRMHSFLVLPIELLAVFVLMHGGGSVVRGWRSIPNLSKVLIAIYAGVSIYISVQPPADAFSAAVGLSRAGFAGLLALALLGSAGFADREWRTFWAALAVGAVAYYGVFAAYVMSNTLTVQQWVGPFPGFNNIRHVAFLGLIAFGGGLGYLLIADNAPSWHRDLLASFGFGIPALTFILWTGSRGPLLALMFATLCCFALFWRRRRCIAPYAFISITLAIVIASLLPLPNPIYGVWQAFGLADVNSETLNAASSGRLETWQYTFGKALERPLFGWGVNQYNHFLPDAREQLFHPHNYPVQLLFASGFGGTALLLLAVSAFVLPRLRYISSDSQKFNGALLLTLLLYSLYDGILYFAYPMMIFTIVFIGCLQPPPAPDRSD